MNTSLLAMALAACCSTVQAQSSSTEEAGSGLKALVHLGIRYEPNRGTQESLVRPRCQDQNRAEQLSPLRIGHATTACIAWRTAPEPLHRMASHAGLYADIALAGERTWPRERGGKWFNRASHPLWSARWYRGQSPAVGEISSPWVLGANYVLAGGSLLIGFGDNTSCQENLHILPDRQCMFH